MRAMPERARMDLFLMDVRLPDANGIDLLRELQAAEIPAPVIMISGHATIADAVEATRAGAFDFLEKPLGRDRVMVAVKNALEQGKLKQENKRLRDAVGPGTKMIGSSPAFQRAVEQASMAARSDARVLLIGESGTGKELLAAHIHEASPFASGPFVKVNCAAIPGELIESELFGHEKGSFTGATSMRRGKFEMADHGTLFLDEIGDLHCEFAGEAAAGVAGGRVSPRRRRADYPGERARDLGHEPRSFGHGGAGEVSRRPVLPRERGSDSRAGAARAAAGYRAHGGVFPGRFLRPQRIRQKSFDAEVWEPFEEYSWPGNARELRNVVERMAILSHGDVLNNGAILATDLGTLGAFYVDWGMLAAIALGAITSAYLGPREVRLAEMAERDLRSEAGVLSREYEGRATRSAG